MTKDYAPKPRAKAGRRRAGAKKTAPSWRAFSPGSFVGGVVCCAVAVLALDHAPALAAWLTAEPAPAQDVDAATPDERPLTYEFIHRLPSEVVRTHVEPYEPPPADAADTSGAENAENAPPSEAHVYLLQAGSFLRGDDAEAMRAELLLEGMTAKVSRVPRASGGAWHRVLVGPFADRDAMRRGLTKLRDLDIPALPLVRKKQRKAPPQATEQAHAQTT